MKKSCIIIGAAPCKTLEFLDSDLLKNAYIIAADGGYKTAMKFGLSVDAFVGDLDSNDISPNCADVLVLPREKDFGDVHTAVIKALDKGCDDFYLVGCSGGRADHYIANIYLLEMMHKKGVSAVLIDEHNEIRYIKNESIVIKTPKKYVSLLPLSEKIEDITFDGLKYPLSNATLYRDTPIGISNELIADEAIVSIGNGEALLIFSEDE